MSALNYFIPDFDAAADVVDMYAPIEAPDQFKIADRNAAINFRDPMTFTEMITLTTFIAQILFGGEQARSVEPRHGDDDTKADAINGLLAWNDAKNSIYLKGWLWVWDCVCYNRGIWYEGSGQDVKVEKEEVEEDDITAEKIPALNKDGTPKIRKGEPVMVYPKSTRWRNRRNYSGFFNTVDQVSPYDFICDPTLPLTRFQEGRFAGHRVMIPWLELKRRSELDPSDDQYVLPDIVKKIKTQKGNTMTPAALGGTQGVNTSRTFFERQLRGATAAGIGGIGAGLVTGADSVNKEDGGVCECFVLTLRQKPKTIGLYPDDEEAELFTMLITNNTDVLSVNVRPNTHDEFPYCIGEARPNAHRQFGPGMALAIKPVQDRVDQLNRVHAQAQARMGNILVVDDVKCDMSALLTPDKNGLVITRRKEGSGEPVDNLVSQIKLTDTTASYPAEKAAWVQTAETTTGAHAYVQGTTDNEEQTATQFSGTQDMATGRISSYARLLSEGALVQQTRRFVLNMQQFMPDEQMIKVLGKGSEFDPENPPEKYKLVKKADIQCEFDVVPHDGSLPGADAKVIAASSRAIEAYSTNPALAVAFDNTIPGSLDPIRILRDLLKKSGLPTERFSVTKQQAIENLRQKQLAAGMGVMAQSPPSTPAPVATVPTGAGAIPSAESIPAIPQAVPTAPTI